MHTTTSRLTSGTETSGNSAPRLSPTMIEALRVTAHNGNANLNAYRSTTRRALLQRGLIKRVSPGKKSPTGGYVITDAGTAALAVTTAKAGA